MLRKTTIFQKAGASLINAVVILIFFIPVSFFMQDIALKKIAIIGMFFFYNILFLVFNKNRCLGMIVFGTHYSEKKSKVSHIIYNILYTLSFSTLLFWFYFPLDLFIANMLLLQLPMVLLTRTTLHGYLAGRISTSK